MTARPSIARSLPAVYAAAAVRMAFPLLLLPLMAARLGAEGFGRLSLLLVWAALLSAVVEGGFLAAATRLAVRADAAGRQRLAQQVFSARVLLAAAVWPLAVAVVALVLRPPGLAEAMASVAWLALAATALGGQANWYLQATGQLHRWARVELLVYAVWALGVALLARGLWAYLLLQALATGGLAAAGWWWVRRDLRDLPALGDMPAARLWQPGQVRTGLALGGAMLPVSLAGAAYSYALPAVASAQMARAELGLYYLADRLVRALLAAAEPLHQLVYPRTVARFAQGARPALAYALKWAAMGAVAGALLYAAGWWAWPGLQPWLAGAGRSVGGGAAWPAAQALPLAPVLAPLGLLLPVLLGWKFVGYWMLGSGRFDGLYKACMVVGGLAGLAGAWCFGGQGAATLAWVAVALELLVIAVAVVGMAWSRRAPVPPPGPSQALAAAPPGATSPAPVPTPAPRPPRAYPPTDRDTADADGH